MLDARKIWSSSQLPTLPVVAVKLLEFSRNPETEMKDVVDLIKTDPAISAKILKAVNSTFFGFTSRVTSIDRAAPLLGTTVVTSLALSFSLVEAAMTHGPLAGMYSSYWLQSVVQAAAAESLSSLAGDGLACEYFLTGLLLDLGRLAMLKTIPDHYRQVLQTAQAGERDLWEIEREQLGFDHTQIGAELMKNWNLPESVAHSCRLHHASLSELQSADGTPDYSLVKVAAVASAVGDYFCTAGKGLALNRLRELTSAFFGFDEDRLTALLEKMRGRIDETATMFSVNTSDLGDPSDLMASANEQLAHLALRAQVASTQAEARQKELESKNEALQKQALHDPLTKVYNRRYFDEAMSKETQRCCRYAASLGVLFVDVDRFKLFNDTHGHKFGDTVLARVATIVGETLRSADTLARYGGEEFVVLVSQPTEKGIEKLAERIRVRVESEQFDLNGKRVAVTVSVGASLTIPGRGDLAIGPRLIEAADQAMYQAKQEGRNQVRVKLLLDEDERRLAQSVMQRRFSRWLVNRGALDMPTVSKALLQVPAERFRIGDLAQKANLLTPPQISLILDEQERDNIRFGQAAIRLGYLSEPQLVELLATQQEDPANVAACLIRLGHLELRSAQLLLQEYYAERAAPATAGAATV